MENIRQEIRNFVVANYLFNQEGTLKNDDSFMELGIVDSTGILELVSFLQERFGIELDDELSPENLDSIECLTRFVSRKLSEQGNQYVNPDAAAQSAVGLVPQERSL
jgi:acyl carrier protein